MHISIYARVSTAEQRDGRTIQSQLEELKRVALAQKHVVVRSYTDDGFSGALLNRPGLDRLRDEATQGDFEGVLVNDVDRLSRDVAHLAVVRRDLERKKVKLLFSKLPNDTGPLNNFMVNILGSFAEFERALIADRTRRGKRHKTEDRGLIMGNVPPYGYDYVKKDKDRGIEGCYTINKPEAEVVREMFSWVVDEGLSVRAVMRRLNEQEIPARHSSSWAKSSTARVLANETYAGTTHYNKHNTMPYTSDEYRPPKRRLRRRADWVPITLPSHLHLISKDTFERAQEQRRKSRVHSPRGSRYFYLLRVCSATLRSLREVVQQHAVSRQALLSMQQPVWLEDHPCARRGGGSLGRRRAPRPRPYPPCLAGESVQHGCEVAGAGHQGQERREPDERRRRGERRETNPRRLPQRPDHDGPVC